MKNDRIRMLVAAAVLALIAARNEFCVEEVVSLGTNLNGGADGVESYINNKLASRKWQRLLRQGGYSRNHGKYTSSIVKVPAVVEVLEASSDGRFNLPKNILELMEVKPKETIFIYGNAGISSITSVIANADGRVRLSKSVCETKLGITSERIMAQYRPDKKRLTLLPA